MYPLLEKTPQSGLHPGRRNAVVDIPATDGADDTAVEGTSIWRPASLGGAEFWAISRTARAWTSFHTTYVLCVPRRLNGRQIWRYGGATHELGLTSTLVLAPGELSVARPGGPTDLDLLLVPPALIERVLASRPASGDDGGAALASAVIEDTALVAAFDRLRRSLETPAPEPVEQQCRLESYLEALVERARLASARGEEETRCGRALDRVRTVIMERYAERITLDDLATETGFSKFYLERSFNDRFGVPIHQFLKRVRIGMALAQMRLGLRPSSVARTVGFADQPHMTRVFRDELGFTPRSYWAASRAPQARRPRRVQAAATP